jgi:hypothetical protein
LEPEVQLKISKIPHFHEAVKQEYEIWLIGSFCESVAPEMMPNRGWRESDTFGDQAMKPILWTKTVIRCRVSWNKNDDFLEPKNFGIWN